MVTVDQWPTMLGTNLENHPSEMHCPDNPEFAKNSYGMNGRALRMSGGDSGKILLLDFDQPIVHAAGRNTLGWPEHIAPRHRGGINANFFDGSVQEEAPANLDPRVDENFERLWLPVRSSFDQPANSNTLTQAMSQISTSCPEVPNLQNQLVAHYSFDNPNNLGEDATGLHAATYDPNKCISVEDAERCRVALFRTDAEAGSVGPVFRITGYPLPTSGVPDWTIAYWWKNDPNGGSLVVLAGTGPCSLAARMHLNDGATMWTQGCLSQSCSLGTPAATGQWQHFVGSMSLTASMQRVYINGVLRGTCPAGGGVVNLQSLVLNGMDYPVPGIPLVNYGQTGHFDDIRIYNRALSDAEVLFLYQNGLSTGGGTTTGSTTTGSTTTGSTTTGSTTTTTGGTTTGGTTTGSGCTGVIQIADDDAATYVDSWTDYAADSGYNGNFKYHAGGGNGSNSATWTFTGLPPGQYQVSATWSAFSIGATNAPYIITGDAALPAVRVNQVNPPTANVVVGGVNFQNLATVTITGTTITVRLTDDANNYVFADAVRISCLESGTTTGGTTTGAPPPTTTTGG